ncbi:MAG TPA: hypothetical protein VM785_12060, partial [Gaiellales bacterium]|nr:hypothetical protein [Gaiellales bacterium]
MSKIVRTLIGAGSVVVAMAMTAGTAFAGGDYNTPGVVAGEQTGGGGSLPFTGSRRTTRRSAPRSPRSHRRLAAADVDGCLRCRAVSSRVVGAGSAARTCSGVSRSSKVTTSP